VKPRSWGWLLLAITILFALAPIYRSEAEISVRQHHLLHVALLVGASLSGLLLAAGRALARRSITLLVLSVISPTIAMLLMWPSDYSPLERLPAPHAAEHLGLVLFGFLTGFAGRRYAPGLGIVMSLSLWGMGLLCAWGFGTSPPSQVSTLVHSSITPNP
jgi:hypothetical protein